MKTATAIIIKFVVILAAAWISFRLYGTAAFWTVVLIAAAATALNYLVGDLLILPRLGNIISALINGVMAGALAWVILMIAPVTYYFMTSVYIFAAIVAVAEFFFHMYLLSAHVVEKKKSDADLLRNSKLNYNTETGSELYPYRDLDSLSSNKKDYNSTNKNRDDY